MGRLLPAGLVIVGLALFNGACSVFGGKAAEEPSFRIVLADGNVEVREYQAGTVARTAETGAFGEAVERGFRRLFAYIAGANAAGTEIDMAAPVLVAWGQWPTSPMPEGAVRQERGGGAQPPAGRGGSGWSIGFLLPARYDASTAPAPARGQIYLHDLPARCAATIRFSGRLRADAANAERRTLERWLQTNGLHHEGDWQMAGYHPPWTLPMLRRNEVLVTLTACP